MPAGRPKAELDKAQFESLCKLQCTQSEICAWFGVTDKTLTRWCRDTYGKKFSEVFAEKREGGRISLRRAQFRLAETNATMAIFLGKQFLGQTDRQELAVKSIDDTTAEMEAYFAEQRKAETADGNGEEKSVS